jgi:HTH-type transcriptional regulator, sugar sensing transcriptional regulator
MNLTELNKIGLTEGEIKVYDALLELGETTKTSLAKKSGVSPSNIYDITNRLIEKGIISSVEKNGVAHFSPTNPRHILDFINDKEKDIEKERDLINQMMPFLISKFTNKEEKSKVEVFQGWNGLKTVFEDLIYECRKGDLNYVFGASKGENEGKADIFFNKFSRARADKGIKTKIIFNEELKKRKERIEFFNKSKAYEIRFLLLSTPAEIMIYKTTSMIIILTEEPLVIRIKGKEVSDSFIQYFNTLWKIAKK